jgi:hypothetical protein
MDELLVGMISEPRGDGARPEELLVYPESSDTCLGNFGLLSPHQCQFHQKAPGCLTFPATTLEVSAKRDSWP